jgi:hypothetical protein
MPVKDWISCRQKRDGTASFRTIQLGSLDHHDERKKGYCFSRSEFKVIASLRRKTL